MTLPSFRRSPSHSTENPVIPQKAPSFHRKPRRSTENPRHSTENPVIPTKVGIQMRKPYLPLSEGEYKGVPANRNGSLPLNSPLRIKGKGMFPCSINGK